MIRVYCDTGGFDRRLLPLARGGRISLHTFKYENPNRRIKAGAIPSGLRYDDTPVYTYEDLKRDEFLRGITYDDLRRALVASKFNEIIAVVGKRRRTDAQHLDSAYLTGCRAFLTSDSDDLAGANRARLGAITCVRIFCTAKEWHLFLGFIDSEG